LFSPIFFSGGEGRGAVRRTLGRQRPTANALPSLSLCCRPIRGNRGATPLTGGSDNTATANDDERRAVAAAIAAVIAANRRRRRAGSEEEEEEDDDEDDDNEPLRLQERVRTLDARLASNSAATATTRPNGGLGNDPASRLVAAALLDELRSAAANADAAARAAAKAAREAAEVGRRRAAAEQQRHSGNLSRTNRLH
jgi:hypothetical protein